MRPFARRFTILVGLISPLIIAGCATHQATKEHHENVAQKTVEKGDRLPTNDLGLIRSEGYFLGSGRAQDRASVVLFNPVGSPGLHTDIPMDISMFAKAFSEHIGMPVNVANDVFQSRNSNTSGSNTFQRRDLMGSTQSSGSRAQLPELRYSVSGEETIKSALNRVVSQHGFGWRFQEATQSFLIYRYETAVFELPFPKSDRNVAMSLSGGQLSSSMNSSNNTQETVLQVVSGLMSDEGEVHFTETGSMVVSDTPTHIQAVRSFIEQEKTKLSRQALLQVRLFTLDETADADYALNWDVIYNNGHRVANYGSVTGLPGVNRAAMTVINPDSNFNGSVVSIDALAQDSKVSVAYENNFLTLSGSAVAASETRKTAYLKSVSASEGIISDRITTTLEPGEIDTGLSMYLHPVISGDDIILSLGFSHISLIGLNSEQSGASRITTPETAGRDTTQTVRLNNGGAVALSGFYVSSATSYEKGTGSPGFKLLGGSSERETVQRRAVLVITANIVE